MSAKMNDTDKKMLTEWMGECWHEYPKGGPSICIKCDDFKAGGNNRTFTTWQDLGDVKDKLVEKGLWVAFIAFCARFSNYWKHDKFTLWLFRPVDEKGDPHFCRLVAEFKPWENEARI